MHDRWWPRSRPRGRADLAAVHSHLRGSAGRPACVLRASRTGLDRAGLPLFSAWPARPTAALLAVARAPGRGSPTRDHPQLTGRFGHFNDGKMYPSPVKSDTFSMTQWASAVISYLI